MSDDISNVIPIKPKPKKPEQVLNCPNCDGQHFYLHFVAPGKTGDIQCRSCDKFLSGYCWGLNGSD